MPNSTLLRTLAPYAPNLRPHPASTAADWDRFLAAWRDPPTVWPRCPGERGQSTECGDILIRRRSKRGGFFLGCASFPSCKYTRGARAPIILPGQLPPFTPAERAWYAKRAKAKRAAKKKKEEEAKAVEAARLKWLEPGIQLDATNFDYREWFGEDWVDG